MWGQRPPPSQRSLRRRTGKEAERTPQSRDGTAWEESGACSWSNLPGPAATPGGAPGGSEKAQPLQSRAQSSQPGGGSSSCRVSELTGVAGAQGQRPAEPPLPSATGCGLCTVATPLGEGRVGACCGQLMGHIHHLRLRRGPEAQGLG